MQYTIHTKRYHVLLFNSLINQHLLQHVLLFYSLSPRPSYPLQGLGLRLTVMLTFMTMS